MVVHEEPSADYSMTKGCEAADHKIPIVVALIDKYISNKDSPFVSVPLDLIVDSKRLCFWLNAPDEGIADIA